MPFLFANWKLIGLGLIVAAVGVYVMVLRTEIKLCSEHLQAAQDENVALRHEIETQNAAIAALKAEGDRRVAAASKGAKAARQATVAARSEAERLRVAAKAPGAPVACPAGRAVQTIRGGL